MKKFMLQTLIPLTKVHVVHNVYFYDEVILFNGIPSPIKFLISALPCLSFSLKKFL